MCMTIGGVASEFKPTTQSWAQPPIGANELHSVRRGAEDCARDSSIV